MAVRIYTRAEIKAMTVPQLRTAVRGAWIGAPDVGRAKRQRLIDLLAANGLIRNDGGD